MLYVWAGQRNNRRDMNEQHPFLALNRPRPAYQCALCQKRTSESGSLQGRAWRVKSEARRMNKAHISLTETVESAF